MYQPIKFTKQQYRKLRSLVRKEFGNVSVAKGIYLITFIYFKHMNPKVREYYRRKYYTTFQETKLKFKRRRYGNC